MANVLANLARVRSATTGTGSLALGAAVTGALTFTQAGVSDGAAVTYAIEDYDNNNLVTAREIGRGTFSGSTLTRDSVYASTNAGSKINCSGRQHVFITAAKEDFDTFLTSAAASSAYQPLDSDLTTIAANITAAGHAILDDASASAQRTTLGLGTAAVENIGTSGATVPLLSTQNTFSANQLIVKASANMNVVASSGDATHYIAAISGQAATARWTHWNGSAVSDRWLFGKNATAESGSDVGSNFDCYSYTDAGAFKNTIWSFTRAGDLNFHQGIRSQSVTGGSKGAGTLNFGTLYEEGTSLAVKYARIAAINTFTENQIVQKASANLNIISSSGNSTQYIAAVAGNSAETRWVHWSGSAVVDRWLFGKSTAAESGSDVGSNLDCYSYTDAGGFKNTILRFTRAGDINFFQGIRSNGVTGGNLGAGTANFTTLYEAGTSLAAKYGALASANVWTAAQTVRIDNATTNAVTVGATLSHTTSGTPANGIGVSLAFEAETTAGNNEVGATLAAVVTDVTSTSEDFDLVVNCMAAGATAAEVGRHKSTGTYKMPSFTVANLPAGTAGEISFASNGRNNGEGAAAGTGVLVFHDGTAWRACDTGATVAA